MGVNYLENGDIHKPSTETCRIATVAAEAYRERRRLPMAAAAAAAGRELSHCAIS
jgi:hypothetical protein